MTVFPRYCPFWSMELHHNFVLKRHLKGWREVRVFKLQLITTIKRCATYWVYRNKSPSRRKGELSLSHSGRQCSDLTQVRPAASLGTMTTFPMYCPLWSVELYDSFVLKRRLKGWKNVGVYKLCLTSTPKRCETY